MYQEQKNGQTARTLYHKDFFLTEHNLAVVTLHENILIYNFSAPTNTTYKRKRRIEKLKNGICFNQCGSFESLTGQL